MVYGVYGREAWTSRSTTGSSFRIVPHGLVIIFFNNKIETCRESSIRDLVFCLRINKYVAYFQMKGKSSKVNHQWERLEMTLWKSSGCRRKTIFPVGRGSFAASWELAKVPQMRLSLKCVISYLHLKMLRVIYLSEKSSTSDNRYKLKQKKNKNGVHRRTLKKEKCSVVRS